MFKFAGTVQPNPLVKRTVNGGPAQAFINNGGAVVCRLPQTLGSSKGPLVSKIHQWLVVRGRAAIWEKCSEIFLELDPEGAAYCVLSVQDAQEIAGIIAGEARVIWENSKEVLGQAAEVEGDSSASCKLQVRSGVLQVMIHNVEPLVAISFDSNSVCRMDVAQAVALVQILQRMAEVVERR